MKRNPLMMCLILIKPTRKKATSNDVILDSRKWGIETHMSFWVPNLLYQIWSKWITKGYNGRNNMTNITRVVCVLSIRWKLMIIERDQSNTSMREIGILLYYGHSTNKKSWMAHQYLIFQLFVEQIIAVLHAIFILVFIFLPYRSPAITKAMLSHIHPMEGYIVMVRTLSQYIERYLQIWE